jgi:Delta7-sterol 5-desaturase
MNPVMDAILPEYGASGAWALMFFLIFLRYIVLAGLAFLVFYGWKRRQWLHTKIQQKFPHAARMRSEILHSALTCAIFAGMAFGVYLLRKAGYGAMYFDISEYGWGYYGFSIGWMIVAHDTYFYWTHRLMHHPRLFRIFHLVHHQSNNPTPFTAFSFHPLEAVVEFGIVPLIALLLPMHPTALLVFTMWSMIFNVLGHTGFEFSPSGFTRHWLFKWINTPTHHNMHHSRSGYNYSLYFNFWDRVMGTNHPEYDAYFESVKARKAEPPAPKNTAVAKTGIATVLLLCSQLAWTQPGIQELKNGHYGTPEARAAQADNLMQQGLGLDAGQLPRVQEINLRYARRTETEVVKADLSDWGKYRRISAMQKEKDAELKHVLRKDQMERYVEKRDELFWQAVKAYFF